MLVAIAISRKDFKNVLIRISVDIFNITYLSVRYDICIPLPLILSVKVVYDMIENFLIS